MNIIQLKNPGYLCKIAFQTHDQGARGVPPGPQSLAPKLNNLHWGKTLQTYLVLLQQIVICIADKGVLLGASVAGAQNISKTDILKALILEA